MTAVDWSALPVHEVPVDRLVFPCHDLDPEHVHPAPEIVVTSGPIRVEALVDGSFFIHDGRHRSLRARLRGDRTIPAHVLDH